MAEDTFEIVIHDDETGEILLHKKMTRGEAEQAIVNFDIINDRPRMALMRAVLSAGISASTANPSSCSASQRPFLPLTKISCGLQHTSELGKVMITRYLPDLKETIRPEQLALLQRVFDPACSKAHIAKARPGAEGLAATFFRLFKSGLEDEEDLHDMLSKPTVGVFSSALSRSWDIS